MTDIRVSKILDRKAFTENWKARKVDASVKPFSGAPWISSLFETASEKAALFSVDLSEDGDFSPVAFAGIQKRKSFLHDDTVAFMESGEEVLDRIYPEYLDVIGSDHRTSIVAALFNHFDAIGEFQFRNCSETLQQCIFELSEVSGLKAHLFNEQPTFQIDLEKVRSEGEYLNLASKSLREKIRRSKRRYEERGAVSLVAATTAEQRKQAFKDLKDLHGSVWAARGEAGAFSAKEVCQFHETLITKWPDSVEFLSLLVGTQVIGVLYNFKRGGYVCNYQSGFLIEEDNRLAPGFLMHAMAADHYATSGHETYDFLGGDAEYKRRLGQLGETLFSVSVTRPGWRSSLRSALRQGKALLGGRSKTHQP